jgi:hypothetical protein
MSDQMKGRAIAPGQHIEPESLRSGRLHRISRLMALAIKCDGLIRAHVLSDYSDIASLGRVSKPRVTQIMNLLNLAPDIQEYLLFLPSTTLCRDRLSERHLRPIARMVDWSEQRELFAALCAVHSTEHDCSRVRAADGE